MIVPIKSLRVTRMQNTISGRGKARVETPRRVAVIWIAPQLYRMFFTFFASFLVSKQFVTSISNAQASRVRKRNISSSKSQSKNEFKEQRGVETFLPPPVAFNTGNGTDIELIHYPDWIMMRQ